MCYFNIERHSSDYLQLVWTLLTIPSWAYRINFFHPCYLQEHLHKLLKKLICHWRSLRHLTYSFPNMTIYHLMSWMNSGGNLVSKTKVSCLVKDVLPAEDYDHMHLKNFSVRKSLRELDMGKNEKRITFPDDWIQTSVTIKIPMKSVEDGPHDYIIPRFHHCPLFKVICTAFADIQAQVYQILPFKHLWRDPLDNIEEQVYDKLYTSDVWLQAQDDLQKLPREPGWSLEHVIMGLIFFSDTTHLANFETAKAWLLYMYFGNLTKYAWLALQLGACHFVGFLPSVSHLILHECLPLIQSASWQCQRYSEWPISYI